MGSGSIGAQPYRASELYDQFEEAAHEVSTFLAESEGAADEVQVHLEQTSECRVTADIEATGPPAWSSRAIVRVGVFKGDTFGEGVVHSPNPKEWRYALEQGLATLRPGGDLSRVPATTHQPGPLSFDPRLVQAVEGGLGLEGLASALRCNTLHEAERILGLRSLSAEVRYLTRHVVYGRGGNVVGSLHGRLRTAIELNGLHGEVVHQVHAPESMLPLALLGARTWRNMASDVGPPPCGGRGEPATIILHPRALEVLLRGAGPELFSTQADNALNRERATASGLNLADDPLIDGVYGSRGFDDRGIRCARRQLISKGRVSPSASSLGVSSWFPAGADALAPPVQAFSTLTSGRGEFSYAEMSRAAQHSVSVHRLGKVTTGLDGPGSFEAEIAWGVILEGGAHVAQVEPGRWVIKGHLFNRLGGETGVLDDIRLSRELLDTGSAILPYCLMFTRIESMSD